MKRQHDQDRLNRLFRLVAASAEGLYLLELLSRYRRLEQP